MTGIGNKFLLGDRFTFDSISNTLIDNIFDDELVRLGSNESRILLLFCQRPNEVVSRNELYDFVWREQGFEVDDSSLTQAISTLRKQLKDSTKSPQFVKTVPKRGYQLISTVTDISELDVGDDENVIENVEWDREEIGSDVSDQATQLEVEAHMATDNSVSHEDEVTAVSHRPSNTKRPIDLVTKLLFLVSVLLPIFAVMFTSPTQSEFRRLASYHGVVVDTPKNHPDITEWLPSIELCINQYITLYQGEFALDKVIATGGYNDVLTLNYIHKPEYSSANITLKIVANQEEINKVCQRGKSS